MRIRFIEEVSPIKNDRWYYSERKMFLAGWLYISDSGSFKQDEARAIFDRIVETGRWDKQKLVLAEASFTAPAGERQP
jgi:hypothetical protein